MKLYALGLPIFLAVVAYSAFVAHVGFEKGQDNPEAKTIIHAEIDAVKEKIKE